MTTLRVSAAVLLLFGSPVADADDQDAAPQFGTQQPESELEAGWAGGIETGNSTIMAQANTVIAALRARDGARADSEPATNTVEVANFDPEAELVRDGNGSEGCIFMESPGSRIRRWRCYYPNEGEEALNDYQFAEEIRQSRWQQGQIEMLQMINDARTASGQ